MSEDLAVGGKVWGVEWVLQDPGSQGELPWFGPQKAVAKMDKI